MPSQMYNNVTDSLAAAVGAPDTTIIVSDGSKFPSPAGGDYIPLYIIRASDQAHEIVHATSVSGNELIVTRSEEGTDPLFFSSGDTVQIRPTRQSLLELDATGMYSTTSTGTQTLTDALNQRVIHFDTYPSLKALPIAGVAANQPASVTTTGRAGEFVWMPGDRSANILSDPQEGIWVPPDSDTTGASGAWMRQYNPSSPLDVAWFGADNSGLTDSGPAIQAANDYVEKQGRAGGVLAFGEGSYLSDQKLRVGGWVTWRGAGAFSSSLFFGPTLQDHCIVLGPDQTGLFVFSGDYTFGSRIEEMDISSRDVYRGADNAVIYTVGAHQNSGIARCNIRGAVSLAIDYDVGAGAPAAFHVEDVNIQGSAVAPNFGTKIAIRSNAGGCLFNIKRVQIETDNTSPFVAGVQMLKDFLNAEDVHFEGCNSGIVLAQAEPTVRNNTLTNITGKSDVPILIGIDSSSNVEYQIINANNTTISSADIKVLSDNKTLVSIGGPGGATLANYTNAPRRGGPSVAHAWMNYLVGSGIASSYGVSSVTKNQVGIYTVSLSRLGDSVNLCINPSVRFPSAAPGSVSATALTSGTIELRCYDGSNALADPQRIYMTVHTQIGG